MINKYTFNLLIHSYVVAKQIAHTPPTTSFFGRTLEFLAVPDSTHSTLLHRSSDPSSMNRYLSRQDSEVSLPAGVATRYTIKPYTTFVSGKLHMLSSYNT